MQDQTHESQAAGAIRLSLIRSDSAYNRLPTDLLATMISNEALAERKWRAFPELRKLFEQYPVPTDVYGWSSVSDNTAAWIGRLIEIAATINANAKELREETLGSVDAAALSHDVEHLRGQIRCAAREIECLDARLHAMSEVLHRVYSLNEEKLRVQKAAAAKAEGDAV